MTEWTVEEAVDAAHGVIDWQKKLTNNPRRYSGHELRCAFKAGVETMQRLCELLQARIDVSSMAPGGDSGL